MIIVIIIIIKDYLLKINIHLLFPLMLLCIYQNDFIINDLLQKYSLIIKDLNLNVLIL